MIFKKLFITVVAALTFGLTNPTSFAETINSPIKILETNVSGGGFQSDVTISDDGLTIYSSADVSGVFKSSDGGKSFDTFNKGLRSTKVASLAITPDNENILYIGTGDKGSSGGLYRSTNAGESWSITGAGALAQFAGNHSRMSDPVPDRHPRSNGDLIVVVTGDNRSSHLDDIVVAGTYQDGVRIFSQGGEAEDFAVFTDGFVRALAYHPAVPNTVYAAIQFGSGCLDNGIYKIDITAPPVLPECEIEPDYPAMYPEGLTVLGSGNVYGAISEQGIVKFNGSSWILKNTNLDIDNPNRRWTAVTGYTMNNGNDIVYAGVNNLGGTAEGENYSSIWRTGNGGNSWLSLVDASNNGNVSDIIYGKDYPWWYSVRGFPEAGLGRRNNVVSSIDVALGNSVGNIDDDVIYVSGRGGIWKSPDRDEMWQPAVFNMQATANTGVAVNPDDADQVVISNTDYVLLETGERFENGDISRDKPDDSESRGYNVVFDTKANEVILGVGDRDVNMGGEVFKKTTRTIGNPSDSGWINTNLADDSNGRVRAVTYGYHDGNQATTQTILAAVEDEGVFRYFDGTWHRTNGAPIEQTDRSNFIWPDNRESGVVFLLDTSIGLYRSSDGGQNWENIWPDMSFRKNDFFNAGYLTADDNHPTTVYLSIQGGIGSPIGTGFRVYRLTGADNGIYGPPSPDSSRISDITEHSDGIKINRPGPIKIGPNGRLWLTEQQDSPNEVEAGLFVMEKPRTDNDFKKLTTDEYSNIAISPSGIDISTDGHIYISQNTTGLVKIKYVDSEVNNVADAESLCFPIKVLQDKHVIHCL